LIHFASSQLSVIWSIHNQNAFFTILHHVSGLDHFFVDMYCKGYHTAGVLILCYVPVFSVMSFFFFKL